MMQVQDLNAESLGFEDACNAVKNYASDLGQEILNVCRNQQHWNVKEVLNKKEEVYTLQRRKQADELDLAKERASTDSFQNNIHALKEDLSQVRHQKQEITSNIEISEERFRRDMAEMTSSEADRRVKELESQLEKMGNILGLNVFRSTHGSVILTFTNLDRSNPDRMFTIEIKVVNRAWQLIESNPVLSNQEELLRTLNETNNLSGFVSTVRRIFIKMIKQET